MFWSDKAKEAAQEVLEACRNLVLVIALLARLVSSEQRPGVISDRWSYRNRLIVLLRGYSEARGYKAWAEVGRRVKKGEKAFWIMAPWLKLKEKAETTAVEDDRKILVGYRAVPAFGLEQTEPDEQWKEEEAYHPLYGTTGGTVKVFNGYRHPWDQWYRAVLPDSSGQLTALIAAAIIAKVLDHPTELQDLLNRLQAHPAEEIAEKIEEGCKLATAYLDSGDNALSNLRAMLSLRRNGPLAATVIPTVEGLLAEVWDDLAGDDGGMNPDKLRGRMEAIAWNPPILSFFIERHGVAVLGSSRAEVQEWVVDLDQRSKAIKSVGRRQVRPMQAKLDMAPIAQELADAILAERQDDRLKWIGENQVRLLIGKVLAARSVAKETLAGRRKRLREGVARAVASAGWKMVRANVFERTTS